MSSVTTVDSLRTGDAERTPAVKPAARRLSAKRIVLAGLAIAALAGGATYGRYWWITGRFLEITEDAYVGGDVTVIAPKVAGFIAVVAVTDNQAVKAGDLLLRLDDRDARAALARAEANVAAQDAALANLDASRRLQDAMIAQATAEVASSDAETARARFDFNRYRQLSQSSNASEQRFQQADADYKKSLAAAQRTRAAVDASRRQLDVIDTRKRQARAARDQAIAERDIAGLTLSYSEVRAPIDGVIGNRSARVGSYATIGNGLISLVPAHGLWVDANFKESQLAAMRPGEKAQIFADVLPGEVFAGHVVSLAPATGAQFSVLPPENATGNFTKIVQRVPVRIRLDGEGSTLGKLRPGLSVTAYVDRRDETAALQAAR